MIIVNHITVLCVYSSLCATCGTFPLLVCSVVIIIIIVSKCITYCCINIDQESEENSWASCWLLALGMDTCAMRLVQMPDHILGAYMVWNCGMQISKSTISIFYLLLFLSLVVSWLSESSFPASTPPFQVRWGFGHQTITAYQTTGGGWYQKMTKTQAHSQFGNG